MSQGPVRPVPGRPGGAGTQPLAALLAIILAALTMGALGAAMGGWLGWRAAPPLPDNASASALARSLVPRGTPYIIERRDAVFGYRHPGPGAWLLGGHDYTPGYVKLLVTDGEDAPALLSAARDVMGLSGWHISGNLVGAGVAGVKGRLAVRVYPATIDGDKLIAAHTNDAVAIEIGRAEPGRVQPLVITGLLIGLVLGWVGGERVVGRVSAVGVVRRRLPAALGGAAFLLLLPGTLLTCGVLVYALLIMPTSMPAPPSWGQYLLPGVRALSVTGFLLLLATVLVVSTLPALPPRMPAEDAAR
jgi:hypothetical protein